MDYIILFLVLFPCYSLAQEPVTVFVCEGDSHVLNCGDDHIIISTAVYGRTQSNECVTSPMMDCERYVTEEVMYMCGGYKQCTVQASNDIAGDPCPGYHKYLEITYTCEELDWACSFQNGDCGLIVRQGSWFIGYSYLLRSDYIQALGDSGTSASFTIPHTFTSKEGTLSFIYYRRYAGSLSVTVCSHQQGISYGSTYPRYLYEYIPYSCDGSENIEITFTATKTYSGSVIRVVDIQLYETTVQMIASTSPSATSTQSKTSMISATTMHTTPSKQILTSTLSSTSTQSVATTPSGTNTQSAATYHQSPTSSMPVSSYEEHTSASPASTNASKATNATVLQLPSRGVIPAVSSLLALIVIGLVSFAVIWYLRRKSREPKPAGPVDQDDDDPSLYNNPVYVSKEDDFSTPDLLVGINFRNGSSASPAPNGSPEVDNQYEDFDGDQKNFVKDGPLPTNNNSSRAGQLQNSPEAPDVDLVNTNMYHIIERPEGEAIYEEEGHTYEHAQGPAESSWNPNEAAKGQNGTDDVYENSSFASPVGSLTQGHVHDGGENRSSDGIVVLDDDEEYNALTFNQSSDITRALKKPKRVGDHANNGYGVLDLPQDKAASLSTNSAGLHNDGVYNSLDEPTVEQHNGKQSTTGERPNGKGGTFLQPGAESDYHNYQDPTQMDREGSGPRSPDLDVFSDDQYNILDSGKQVGDYHVYQSTNDNDGDYIELDTSKMGGEDEYSTIDLDQSHQPKATGVDTFEPIYSEEVYSEFN